MIIMVTVYIVNPAQVTLLAPFLPWKGGHGVFQGLFQDIFKDLWEQVFVVCSQGNADAVFLTRCQFCKIIILYGVVFETMVYIPKQVLGLEFRHIHDNGYFDSYTSRRNQCLPPGNKMLLGHFVTAPWCLPRVKEKTWRVMSAGSWLCSGYFAYNSYTSRCC